MQYLDYSEQNDSMVQFGLVLI